MRQSRTNPRQKRPTIQRPDGKEETSCSFSWTRPTAQRPNSKRQSSCSVSRELLKLFFPKRPKVRIPHNSSELNRHPPPKSYETTPSLGHPNSIGTLLHRPCRPLIQKARNMVNILTHSTKINYQRQQSNLKIV